MSEYQYYEFQALDRPLSEADKAHIRTLSSRVEPTARSASFVYHYGDFRGDSEDLLERCFDMMLYIANWGTQQLIFRLPKALADIDRLREYELAYGVIVSTTDQSVLVEIHINDEEGFGWTDGEGTLPQLLSLRENLLDGDYRALYLGWLAAATVNPYTDEDDIENTLEPPVPANLAKLTPPLRALADWLRIDPDLVTVAAQASPTVKETKLPIADWVASLSEQEKNRYLVRVAEGDPEVGRELMLTLRQRFAEDEPDAVGEGMRSLSTLLAEAASYETERFAKEAAAAKRARTNHLKKLSSKKENLWDRAIDLIEKKQAKPYDEAVSILVDLKALAEIENEQAAFKERFDALYLAYQRRHSLIQRMRAAKLF
ncbi:MAG: hypothetical protein AAFY78_05995 [Cyanobacteria bacterium J06648_16]